MSDDNKNWTMSDTENKKRKQFTICTILFCLVMLVVTCGTMVWIDPLFQFHEPLDAFCYPITNEGYQNPGIAKSFDYNTIITGSSMMQNNRMEWVNKYIADDAKTVKLTYSGATSVNVSKVLETALKNNPSIQRIIVGVDVHLWERENASYDLPEYLYNEDVWDDVQYVFNDEIAAEYLLPVMFGVTGIDKTTTMSDAYWWAPEDASISGDEIKEIYREYFAEIEDLSEAYRGAANRTQSNLEKNIYPLLKAYPDVTFEFLFPPYHIMYWETIKARGGIEEILKSEECLLAGLSDYANARVHFFSLDEDIIYEYNNYLDSAHYKSYISEYMIEHVGLGDRILQKENVEAIVRQLRCAIEQYDYVTALR